MTLIEAIVLHLFQVFQLYPPQELWLEYLDLLWKMYPKVSYVLTQSLFKRVMFFAESIKHHDDTVVFI